MEKKEKTKNDKEKGQPTESKNAMFFDGRGR